RGPGRVVRLPLTGSSREGADPQCGSASASRPGSAGGGEAVARVLGGLRVVVTLTVGGATGVVPAPLRPPGGQVARAAGGGATELLATGAHLLAGAASAGDELLPLRGPELP